MPSNKDREEADDLYRKIKGSHFKRDGIEAIYEHDARIRAEALREAAERAEVFYRNDCGGCGENALYPCEADGCSHIRDLRTAILADEPTEKGE